MQKEIELFIQGALAEDIGGGDHSSLACIPESSMGTAKLLVKESGILAGVEVAKSIAFCFDKSLVIDVFKKDGDSIKPGDIVFEISDGSIYLFGFLGYFFHFSKSYLNIFLIFKNMTNRK